MPGQVPCSFRAAQPLWVSALVQLKSLLLSLALSGQLLPPCQGGSAARVSALAPARVFISAITV
eukprot:3148960-Rhodomonas_salina.1